MMVQSKQADVVEGERPSVLEGLRHVAFALRAITTELERFWARPEVKGAVKQAVEVVGGAMQCVIAVKSPGYIPYFERLGDNGFVARLRAGFVRHRARLSPSGARGRAGGANVAARPGGTTALASQARSTCRGPLELRQQPGPDPGVPRG